MSQGELIWRRQQEAKRFLSRQQTKDSSLQTFINQAKASQVIFKATPTQETIQGSRAVGPEDRGINNNTYQATPVGACCATTYASGNETIRQQGRVEMKNSGAVICCDASNNDYSRINGYSLDLKPLGGTCCPLPNLVNNAKTTQAEKCASCLQFYFPVPAQPPLCTSCNTPYPSSSLYPPQPIDSELRRYGDSGIPQVGGTNVTKSNYPL